MTGRFVERRLEWQITYTEQSQGRRARAEVIRSLEAVKARHAALVAAQAAGFVLDDLQVHERYVEIPATPWQRTSWLRQPR